MALWAVNSKKLSSEFNFLSGWHHARCWLPLFTDPEILEMRIPVVEVFTPDSRARRYKIFLQSMWKEHYRTLLKGKAP